MIPECEGRSRVDSFIFITVISMASRSWSCRRLDYEENSCCGDCAGRGAGGGGFSGQRSAIECYWNDRGCHSGYRFDCTIACCAGNEHGGTTCTAAERSIQFCGRPGADQRLAVTAGPEC